MQILNLSLSISAAGLQRKYGAAKVCSTCFLFIIAIVSRQQNFEASVTFSKRLRRVYLYIHSNIYSVCVCVRVCVRVCVCTRDKYYSLQ